MLLADLITVTDLDPQKFVAGTVGVIFAAFGFDVGVAFLMRGTDEASGDVER